MKSPITKRIHPHELINHILDQPDLPEIIQHLDTRVLTRLIRHVGLEDSGQLVSLVTSDQLKGILDEDLWQVRAPGREEIFDAGRFGLWLQILLETGPDFAVRKIMEMDIDLLTLGLCRLVRVMGLDDPETRFSDEPEPTPDSHSSRMPESMLNHAFDHYRVMAKDHSYWDAVCTLLMELNEQNDELMNRLLERCRRISGEQVEDNGGLFQVRTVDRMLEEDVAADREQRREDKGFVTPVSAAAFLRAARQTPLKRIMAAKTMDPATRSYLRAAEAEMEPAVAPFRNPAEAFDPVDGKVARFVQTLQTAEVLPASNDKRLTHDGSESWNDQLPLARAMRAINRTDPELYARRMSELSYLSNLLISGCTFKGRTFRPNEAAEGAFSVCNLGSEFLIGLTGNHRNHRKYSTTDPVDFLKEHHLIKMFQAGWRALFHHVVLFTAKSVLGFLERLEIEFMEPIQVHEIFQMTRRLRSAISVGQPWAFSDHADDLQVFLDGEATMTVKDLLQEFPTLPDAVCKKGDPLRSPLIGFKADIRTIRHLVAEAIVNDETMVYHNKTI